MKDFIYKDLSYRINGIVFEAYNELGSGHKEIMYERIIEKLFIRSGISFKRQLPYKVEYKGELIGRYYFDFLVESKIILELKQGNYFSKRNIHQVNEYLKASSLKLALLANFTSDGVKIKRIVNIK